MMLGNVDGSYSGPVVDPTVAYETLLQLGMEPAHAATLLQRHTITVTAAAASPSSLSSPPSYTHSPSRVGGTEIETAAAAAASMLLEGSPDIVVAPSRLRYDYDDDDVEKEDPSKNHPQQFISPAPSAGPNITAYNNNQSSNEKEGTAAWSPNAAGTRPTHLRSARSSSSSSGTEKSGVLQPHDAAADAAHCANASHRTTSYSSSFSGSSSSAVKRHGSHGSANRGANVAATTAAAAAASPQSTSSVHERVHEIVDALLSPYRRQRRDGSGAASTATMSSDSPRRSQRRFSPIARPSHSEQEEEEEEEETAPNLPPPLPLVADTYYDADHLHLWLAGNGRPSYRNGAASVCPRYQAHHHRHPHHPSVGPHSPNDDKAMMLKKMNRIGATHGAIISRSATLCNGDPFLIRQLTAQRARASDAKRQEGSSRSRSHVAGGAVTIGGGGNRQLALAQQHQQLLLLSRVSSLERRQRCDPVRRMHWYEDQWAAAPLRLDVESAAWGQRRQICRSAPRGAAPFSDLYDATGSGHRRAGEWALRVVREHRDP